MFVLLWLTVLALWLLLRIVLPFIPRVRNTVQYSQSAVVDLPLANALQAMHGFFTSLGCEVHCDNGPVRVYQRGCLTCLRVDQDVRWALIPQLVGLAFSEESTRTKVEIAYRAIPTARFTGQAESKFLESARLESLRALELLQMLARDAAVTERGHSCTEARGFGAGLIDDA